MGLTAGMADPSKKSMVVNDCCRMIDEQLAAKSGITGMTLKAAFAALKGIKPGYIPHVVEMLLPECLVALESIWSEGLLQGDPVAHLEFNRAQAAEALLSVTDERVKFSQRAIVRGTYEKLRKSAKGHVEEAVPDLAKVIDKYANS
jgi:hypothetical protein